MIVIKVMERDMIVTTTSRITSGSVNLPVKFDFKGDEWEDLVKTAVFIGSGEERDVALITDECAVPADVLTEAGGDLKIGVYGRLANGATVIPTIWGRVQYIYEGTEMGEPSPHSPEPDWTAQVQQAAATALTKAQAVEAAAAAGDFDGVSPEVTISTIAHGHSVTITDEEHPEGQSFPVLDGASAYEQAVAGGYTGTEAQFNQELKSFKTLSEQAAGSATQAAGSASAAAGSASAAAGSETAAAGSASAAAGAASAAAGSASAAEQSAIAAAAAAEATGGSETAAAASATAAAASATAAADSATAAEEHEYDAEAWADGERKGSPVGSTDKTYHNNAKYYAQQAGASATAAGQSVDAAAASATAAAASATAAAGSASAAETAKTQAEAAKTATETARDTAVSTLQTEGAAQRTAIQQKGAEVLESIPEDYTDLSDDVDDLKSALNQLTDKSDIEFTESQYIRTDYTVDDEPIPLTPTPDPRWRCAVVDCSEGDSFEINIRGGSSPRAWAFVDENNILLSVCPYNADVINSTIIAPESSSKAIFNDNSNGTVIKLGRNGRVDVLEKEVDALQNGDFNNGSISIQKTDFVERVIEPDGNIFNENTMVTESKMYYWYTTAGGTKIHLVENQYVGSYGAICIPLYDFDDITLSTDINIANCYYYAFTDDDDKVLSQNDTTFTLNTTGMHLRVPSGATKFYFNWSAYLTQKNSVKIMCSIGSVAKPYAQYGIYLTFDGARYEPYAESNEITWLNVPSKYELVIGDTFELFYKGIICAVNSDEFYVEIVCPKGKAFKRRYIYTPDIGDAGTYTMSISLYDNKHKFLEQKNVNIVVKAKASSPVTEKVVLYVGDSLAVSGDAPGEFKRRLTGSGGSPVADNLTNITFIGTCEVNGAKFEGYGGYNFNAYNTEHKLNSFMWITCQNHGKTNADQHSLYSASNGTQWSLETIENNRIKIICTNITGALPGTSGTLTWVSGGEDHNSIVYTNAEQAAGNPFWNSTTEKVDFSSYITAQGESSLDFVYVLLGWNSTYVSTNAYKAQVETFISNILADFPSCKIVLLGLEVPAYDGLANNYGSSNKDYEYYMQQSDVWRFNNIYAQIASEQSTNVSYVNVAGQFDTEYNMLTGTRAVNTRNSETEVYQINGVHPAQSGYYQIADACYRDFVHKLQE